MKLKLTLYFLFFTFLSSVVSAQEHLEPLRTNPALVQYTKNAKKAHTPVQRLIADSIMAKLPFLDDFSKGGPYPNDSLWMDNAVYINTTYPIAPPTIGVATFDGVNNEGQPYNPNAAPGSSAPADSLTSRPINLHVYAANDSLWLSFYYQAGGRGSLPLPADTLLLQFRTSSIAWTTVWYVLGYNPSTNDTGFHLVMIPLKNSQYFDPNFQFRFKNYACTSGAVDQWNVDEVYLNKNRNYRDTSFTDVSFVYESPALLANYEYMPWEQFTDNDVRDSMFICERNNYTASLPANYFDTIPDQTGYPAGTGYKGGSANVPPFYLYGYNNLAPPLANQRQSHIPVKSHFNYSALSGPTNITMTQVLSYSSDFIPSNDTLRFTQIFSDYYAYDDGSAEAAYFINGTTPMYLAYQFTLNHPDTLRGLQLYFDYVFVNPHGYNMRLAVWDATGPGGSPGNLLFEDDSTVSPRIGDTLNGFTFYPYHFSSASAATFGGTFYVGWVQTYGDSLNIGYDLNTDHHTNIYYNDGSGGWQQGTYNGSMMMRPVFGVPHSHGPILAESTIETPDDVISIYPNPATNIVNLSASLPANTLLKIYTADGREYLNNPDFSGNLINTSSIPAGFYIVEITPQSGKTFYHKLLIQR